MNVKELQEELAEYDDDLEVVYLNPHVERAVVSEVEEAERATVVDDEIERETYVQIQ